MYVLVTSPHVVSVTLNLLRGNPSTVYGFGSAEERDEYPTPMPLYTMPGNDRFYVPARAALGPHRKWLFEHAVALESLVAQVGQRRIYLLAWFMGEPPMNVLSAGEIDLIR